MQIKLLVACRDRQLAIDLGTRVARATAGAIAAEASRVDSVLRRAAVTRPDVLLLEFRPDEEERAWHVLGRLGDVSAVTRVLMVCGAYTQHMMTAFIQHGASGCVTPSGEPSLYAKAVRAVHAGETWFGRAELFQALRRHMRAEPELRCLPEQSELLTAREREIMAFVGSAMTNKEIARKLKISDHTVKTHLHHIYVKLHKSGRYKAFLSNAPLPSTLPGAALQGGFAGDRMKYEAAAEAIQPMATRPP
jgi:DNA-binding NarL/FixJ family response regulator